MIQDAKALADTKRREAERARRLGQTLNDADRLLLLRLADDLDREADELARRLLPAPPARQSRLHD